jgi:hypothetical protein
MKTIAEKIANLKTPRDGWTKESLAKLGVAWPPAKGWKKKLEGRAHNVERFGH